MKKRGEDTLGVLSPSVGGEGYTSLRNVVPVVRIHEMYEGCEEGGAGGSGHILVNYDRESSVLMTGLSLGPRGSGAVKTVAASGDPPFASPPLALENSVRPGTSAGGAANKQAGRAQGAMARHVKQKFRAVVRNRW